MARGAKLGNGNGRRRVWRCPTVFPDGTCPTVGGASMARGVDGADQEKTGSKSIDCPESDNEPAPAKNCSTETVTIYVG